MATTTRRIGLSLGADICWPIGFEEILAKLDLRMRIGDHDWVTWREMLPKYLGELVPQ